MKVLKSIAISFILLFCAYGNARNAGQEMHGDSVKISLLTCAPSSVSYFLYGHSALCVADSLLEDVAVVNYGEFDWNTSFFIPKFTMGIMDYRMGIEPYDYFRMAYDRMGRRVIGQELNLTPDETAEIMAMLAENYRPENRCYRYNILYDNCTSRLRDIIESHVNGRIEYKPMAEMPTMRELLHKFNSRYRWESFGVDLLLGIQADQPLSRKLYQFLPYNLMDDFDGAEIVDDEGNRRPLVLATKVLVAGDESVSMGEPLPVTPTECFLALLVVTIVVTIVEVFRKKRMWWYDAMFMTACGLAGIVLFLMLFSDHPAVRVNFQMLILNPLPLFFVWRMIKRTRNNQPDWQYKMWEVMIILFFVGGFFQDYAEGMYLVALSLLIRNTPRLGAFYNIIR